MPHEEAPRSQTDVVIHGIKSMIVRGDIVAGARLPIEAELASVFGVSRSSLREGVRALAILGVLETRQGDGTYVTSLDPSVLMSSLAFLADLQDASLGGHLLSVRRVLEGESAALAASRITDADLADLEETLDRIDEAIADLDSIDVERFIDADSAFHSRIAATAGNPTLAALIDSLVGRTMRFRIVRALRDAGTVATAQAEHRAILAQLRRRNVDGARITMCAHILAVESSAGERHVETQPAPE